MLRHIQSTLADRARRLLSRRSARGFAHHQDGTAAVEFALVAVPFLALLFAILQTAIVFFASQTLEAATTDSARLIMTGQAQMAGYSQGDFKKAVCDHLSGGMFDCSKLYVSVNAYSSFGLADTSTPLDTTTGTMTVDVNNLPFSTGGPGSIIVVQLYYQWPIFVSLLNSKLADINGNRLLVATSVLRNEPYQ